MTSRPSFARRRGAVILESAVVYPVLFLLLFGLIVGGLGVFRFQQVAWHAREAARYACVHGARWAKDTGKPCPTAAQIRQDVVVPLAAGMDADALALQVNFLEESTGAVTPWDQAGKQPTGVGPGGAP
jgi:Flp pilus assembly protein TadG